ncbi:hypothetical protein BK133_11190 [Paenibacillus sp. FSL H8-0548]|uniref:hypothetical protein n=1 Tax=Paenibacillus sp. FSL H8-0548 TaxID=1920422 RepID=UPI00096DCC34|nr:hypothetical protein [Paenibacillus sp. FSL H8-0548]OMF35264.1 hypothetical protein BK133_11190 [Paenibacillus sp. FSL H8-0548]
MSFEAALSDELETIPDLLGKVFPLFAPEQDDNKQPLKAPYVLYESSEGVNGKTLGGFSADKTVNCELYILATTYRELKQLTSAVINLLQSFERRAIGSGALFITELTYEPPVELYEPLPRLNRCNIVFKVHF